MRVILNFEKRALIRRRRQMGSRRELFFFSFCKKKTSCKLRIGEERSEEFLEFTHKVVSTSTFDMFFCPSEVLRDINQSLVFLLTVSCFFFTKTDRVHLTSVVHLVIVMFLYIF